MHSHLHRVKATPSANISIIGLLTIVIAALAAAPRLPAAGHRRNWP
jgi:hypothetical protein